jgi:glycosyltransferase involved in cell wall biosynthesis
MALRVGFNATPLLSPLTGIGNYIVHLGAALAASGDVDAYSFYGYRWRHEPPCVPAGGTRGPNAQRVRDLVKPLVPFKRELRQAHQQFLFARGVRRHAIALYHEPNYIPIRYDVPVVTTIHDLSWLRYPETHPVDRVRWLERAMPRALANTAAVLVDSEFVRQEVLATFGIDPARVHTAHLGVSPVFRPRGTAETRATLNALGLVHGEYVLAVGTIEPRKNVRHVLEAYARLPDATRERYVLVIAGAKGWRAATLEAALRTLVERGDIRFLGHVSDEGLPMLYAGAAAFVFASVYEGFGLPPLEAMASGVPVLVAERASLPEVTGDAALKLDPARPDETARTLASMLDDRALRDDFARRGIERAAGFTWEACADATLRVYREVIGIVQSQA